MFILVRRFLTQHLAKDMSASYELLRGPSSSGAGGGAVAQLCAKKKMSMRGSIRRSRSLKKLSEARE